MIYIIMGVAGCGKTTVGRMLAERLSMKFYDADDFHPQDNITKIKDRIPLEDGDRIPWLLNLAQHIAQWNKDKGAVLACSALKEKYRQILSWDGKEEVAFIYLEGNKDTILDQMRKRDGHFFPVELLDSQFNALEAPDDAITVRINKTPEEICVEIMNNFTLPG